MIHCAYIEIVNTSYIFLFFPLLFLSSSAVVAFICSANAYSRACSIASRRQPSQLLLCVYVQVEI